MERARRSFLEPIPFLQAMPVSRTPMTSTRYAMQLEDTAQLFLGVRLQCARCHHHPFEKWSQKDYYGFAAFFSRVGRKAGAQPPNKNK